MKIVSRAMSLSENHGVHQSTMDWDMDITARHANGNPLRLQELLAADDFNFCHDVCGIYRQMNRENGQLQNCFLPRFSK